MILSCAAVLLSLECGSHHCTECPQAFFSHWICAEGDVSAPILPFGIGIRYFHSIQAHLERGQVLCLKSFAEYTDRAV